MALSPVPGRFANGLFQFADRHHQPDATLLHGGVAMMGFGYVFAMLMWKGQPGQGGE